MDRSVIQIVLFLGTLLSHEKRVPGTCTLNSAFDSRQALKSQMSPYWNKPSASDFTMTYTVYSRLRLPNGGSRSWLSPWGNVSLFILRDWFLESLSCVSSFTMWTTLGQAECTRGQNLAVWYKQLPGSKMGKNTFGSGN